MSSAAGAVIARQVVERIRSRCELLAATPGVIGTARPELGHGVRSFPTPPFVLFFRYSATHVQVIRILRERRDAEGSFTG